MTSVRRKGGMWLVILPSSQRSNGGDGSAVGGADGRRGGRRVPVGAGGEDVVAAEVVARESEVLCAQGTVGLLDRTEMACDRAVETDGTARGAAEVSAEEPKRGVELLEHDRLGLDLADLFGDDARPHNRQT